MTKARYNGVHRETLAFHKAEYLLEGTSLARNVETKIRQGKELTPVEAGILSLCITNEQLRFIKRHGL